MDSVFIIAEVGQNHDGSLGQAHAFIDAVARTGANAIKFQTHIAEAESSAEEPFRVKFSRQDATRYDYWKRMEFTLDQWHGLKSHADERGLIFLSSPFSLEAVALLEAVGVPAWKVGSGEVRSRSLLASMVNTGKPLYVSTGMSDFEEIDELVAFLKGMGAAFTLMQCNTAYPTPFTDVGINVLSEYRARYGCPVGLSDHTGTPWPSVLAASLGAAAVEVHVTFSRDMFGPDVKASLTIDDLTVMVQGIRAVEAMLSNPVDKNRQAARFTDLRRMFGKSAVAVRDLPAGSPVAPEQIAFRKPGTGIDEIEFTRYLDRPLARPVRAGSFLSPEDFSQ